MKFQGIQKLVAQTATETEVSFDTQEQITMPKSTYRCTICTRCFSSKQCLREHGFIHTKEKPYTCALCKKRFRHASQFTLHKKSHGSQSRMMWPKLTDLLKTNIEIPYYVIECTERIEIPQISEPQHITLPKFKYF